jgi:thiazole/oxazole-forming peptide maturase SagD family component
MAAADISPDALTRFSDILRAQGFSLRPDGMLRILFARDVLNDGVSSLCPRDRAVLLVEPGGDYWIVGPLLLVDRLSCGACLRHWLRTARWLGTRRDLGDVSRCAQAALRMVAALASQFIEGDPSPYVLDALVSVSADGRGIVHPIYPRRGCMECGQRARANPVGGLRVHCSPLTGIIERMEIGTTDAGGLYHAAATFFTPPPIAENRAILCPQKSYGRGVTPEEAEVSCLAEGLERYSLIYRGDEPIIRARFRDLPGAVHPHEILLFSDRQYVHREEWNSTHSEFQNVPVPFDPETVIGWVEARRLAGGPSGWIPAAHCYMWYALQPGEPAIALSDSNGCGAGRSIEEATLAGLMELVERDAMAIWWYNRLRRPGLPRDELGDEALQRVMASFAAMGRPIRLLDITSDLGIPTVVAIAAREDGAEPFFASSAGWSRGAAARKAVWEVCQIWHSVTRRGECSQELAQWLLTASTFTHPWLVPDGFSRADPEPDHVDLSDASTVDATRVNRGLAAAVERLRSAGLDPMVLDFDRDDVALPVARVVVPGLRHFWGRFSGGRLYEVPVCMGWLREATQEAALNPICCMI